jgi:hypothetical protein
MVAAVELWRISDGGWRARLSRLGAWALLLSTTLAVSGWYFVRNQRAYGHPFIDGLDGKYSIYRAQVERVPYWQRRQPRFFVGWSTDIYDSPYWPAAINPEPCFWPVLTASTFVDYYNYAFAPPPGKKHPQQTASLKPIRSRAFELSRKSALGGTVIAATTAIALVAVGVWLWRRRRVGELAFVVLPVMAVLGQLHFAIAFPLDELGPVKGVYVQFAGAPLCALWGVAVAWLGARPWRWPLALVELAALTLVAAYTIYCCTG